MQTVIYDRARRFIGKILAEAGNRGHAATFNVATTLVQGFALPEADAWHLLVEWNQTNALPPWSEAELRHKLRDAGNARGPAGYLLRDQQAPVDQGTQKAAKRRHWPAFRKPTAEDLTAIAALRGVSVQAAYLVSCHRHLWRCRWRDAECLGIRSGSFAQVRRMDDQPFTRSEADSVKALNLPGSEGAFLNPGGMGNPGVPILLPEGAISLLEATEATLRADAITGAWHSVAIVAAVSAQSRLTARHLAKLAGRCVRIIADSDPVGEDASANWAAGLRGVGCVVECVRMPSGMKDLGDALRSIPARDSFWQKLLAF